MSSPAQRSTFFDRRLAGMLSRLAADAPVQLKLWDGVVIGPSAASTVGTIAFKDRAALVKLLVDPELGFGDGCTDGRIEVEGDLLEVLESVARRTSEADGSR